MSPTGIEWTDETWNPITGCTAVSPGCDHCYAERQSATRLSKVPAYAGLTKDGKWTGELRYHATRLEQPLRWSRPRMIFVNSMSDLFHPNIPSWQLANIFAVMAAAERHQFQILTKRPQVASRMLNDPFFQAEIAAAHANLGLTRWPDNRHPWPIPNIWIGTSIENHAYRFRARHLQECPAAIRFLSIEPLLGPIQFRTDQLADIDWMIVGGESGPGARWCHEHWIRPLRDQAQRMGIAFHFKQAGLRLGRTWGCKTGHGSDWEHWPEDLRIREYPTPPRQRLINILGGGE